MSQDTRRRIAARTRLRPRPQTEDQVPERFRVRRFSEGLERAVVDRMQLHVGRFSQGVERHPEATPDPEQIGRFSRGQDGLRGTDIEAIHVGRFDDIDPPDAP